MSKSQSAIVEYVLEMIENIETVIERHGGIVSALDDAVEGRAAILMFLLQCGESLHKLDPSLKSKYRLETEARGAYDVRNFIAHDYEGVNIVVIETILRDHLPVLKTKMQNLLSGLS